MRRRILTFSAILSGMAVIITSILVTAVAYRDFYSAIQKEVVAQSSYIESGVELMGMEYLKSIEHQAGHRLTLIDANGAVRFDTVGDSASMDNHLNRPEVQAALASGSGESTRYSDTMREQTYYYAVRLTDGTVLRMSSTTKSLIASFGHLFWLVTLIAVGVFGVAFVIASLVTRRIVRPINEIDLDHPELGAVYDELTPLLKRMKSQNDQIREQMELLDRQRAEFISITENMSEGFLVLDRDAHILSSNASALRLLEVPSASVIGRSILTLNRSETFRSAINAALNGTAQECMIQLGRRCCQLLVNPVWVNEAVNGVVIVLMDITEKHERDRLRREFTANVSHELKTPLTTISGYAEIIMNGVAKQDDIPSFSADIYKEAQRLIRLVRDLIFLSKLDEGGDSPQMEPVNLLQLSAEVAERLQAKVDAQKIILSISGEPVEVMGIPSVLDEMVFNLVDNAVKYNREGGKVFISVEKTGDGVVLSVSDTGCGIPEPEQVQVFERFYRVDKSRNEAIPGTGLGLAIVKHGAFLHSAKIQLESTADVGTMVKLCFFKS